MKKLKLLMLGLASIWLLQACEKDDATKDQEKAQESLQQIEQYLTANGIDAQKSEEGFYYVIKPGTTRGLKPQNTGDQLTVQFVGKLLNGTVFNRNEPNKPLRYGYNDVTIIRGLNMGLGLMNQGDTADIYLPSNLAFDDRPVAGVPTYSPVWFNLVLEEVMTEDEALKKYITDKKLTNINNTPPNGIPTKILVRDVNGAEKEETYVLYHITTKEGTGAEMDRNKLNKVTVNYRGLLLDGTEFDKGTAVPFELQEGKLIKGFLEGMLRMKTGEKAVFLIPSGLGYRDKGSSGAIRPYTPLVFEVELLKVE